MIITKVKPSFGYCVNCGKERCTELRAGKMIYRCMERIKEWLEDGKIEMQFVGPKGCYHEPNVKCECICHENNSTK